MTVWVTIDTKLPWRGEQRAVKRLSRLPCSCSLLSSGGMFLWTVAPFQLEFGAELQWRLQDTRWRWGLLLGTGEGKGSRWGCVPSWQSQGWETRSSGLGLGYLGQGPAVCSQWAWLPLPRGNESMFWTCAIFCHQTGDAVWQGGKGKLSWSWTWTENFPAYLLFQKERWLPTKIPGRFCCIGCCCAFLN